MDEKQSSLLLKVLTAHFHALASAKCDEMLLKDYSALLRFLRARKGESLEELFRKARRKEHVKALPNLTANDVRKASLEDLEKLVNNEETPRIDLEYIAIQRFSVPRGSMRSFSNRQMLADKLRTLISNERTHETIGAVARGQIKRQS